MLQKISFIALFILLLFCSNLFANNRFLSLTYSNGNDSNIIHQQKEEQTIYGIEYGKKLSQFEHLWISIEGAYSKHRYTNVKSSFLIKCWGIYKTNITNTIDIFGGIGIGLSTYKDNVLVKRNPSSSLGIRIGLEYKLTEKVSFEVEGISEHNSGIHKDDRGRNIELGRMGFRFYF